MTFLDPRRHPVRADLAAAALRDRVSASRYAEGVPWRCTVGRAIVRGDPSATARQTTELLFGEIFTVFDRQEGWAWGQISTDGYVGYVRPDALGPPVSEATHRIGVLRTFLFPHPDLKSIPIAYCLPFTAAATVEGEDNGFARLAGGGWVFAKHLAPLDAVQPDYVATALRFLGLPYLWGGRTALGLDCSGLVQTVLAAAGIAAPRDSDMQAAELGAPVEPQGDLRRGDLVFFPGHVAIALDAGAVVHATGFSLSVMVEPLAELIGRAGPITAVRRLAPATAGTRIEAHSR